MIEVLPHLLVGGGSVMGSLLAVDRGLPWVRAAAASASQGRGVKELLHLHRTVPVAARRLRVSASNPVDPAWYGIRPFQALLGHVDGKATQADRDRSVVVFGPPGSGKSSLMICNVMSWLLSKDGEHEGGVVVCGSEAPDVLRACAGVASRHGRAYVYDPSGSLRHRPQRGVTMLHWSPMRGGTDGSVALERAKSLMAKCGEGTTHEAYFRDSAHATMAALIHAGALEGLPWSTVYGWAVDFASKNEHTGGGEKALNILLNHHGASRKLIDNLVGAINLDERTLSPITSTMRTALIWSAKDELCDAADAAMRDEIDFGHILCQKGTSIFFVCPAGKDSDDVGPLVVGFLDEINKALRELACKSETGRVPVPVLRALDEAKNYPIDLPECLALDRKYGISTMAIGQDLAQFKGVWGATFAEEILTTANVKVLLPGIGSSELLTWASEVTGYHIVTRTSKQTTSRRDRDKRIDEDERGATEKPGRILGHRWLKDQRTETESQTREPIMDKADIANLAPGTAWVKIGEKPAGIIDLPLHFKRKPFSDWTAMEVAEDVEFDDAVSETVAEPEPEEEEEPAAAVAGGGWVRVIPGGKR